MEARFENGRLLQIIPEELQDAPRPKDFVPIWKRFADEMADVPDVHVSRPDKQYSLTDCISMQMMRELGIFEILTHDHHFAPEGFVALLRDGI